MRIGKANQLAILAALVAILAAAAAQAQEKGPGGAGIRTAQVPSVEDVEEYWTGTDRSVKMLDTVPALIESIRSKTATPEQPLAHLETARHVVIIPFTTLEGSGRDHDLTVNEALRQNAGTIREIRDQIRLNVHAVRALEAEGYSADQVLTWESSGTEVLAIVVDDRAGGD